MATTSVRKTITLPHKNIKINLYNDDAEAPEFSSYSGTAKASFALQSEIQRADFTKMENFTDFKYKYGQLMNAGEVYHSSYIKHLTYCDYIKIYKDTINTNNLELDGICGAGKSTILSNSQSLKVNRYFNVADYNINPHSSFNYLFGCVYMRDVAKGFKYDRSAIANLVFLIMAEVSELISDLQSDTNLTLGDLINTVCSKFNVFSILSYIKTFNYNVIIFTNSNIAQVKEVLKERGNLYDTYATTNDLQILLQNAIYGYIAQILGYTCIDLGFLSKIYAMDFEIDIDDAFKIVRDEIQVLFNLLDGVKTDEKSEVVQFYNTIQTKTHQKISPNIILQISELSDR